MLIRLCYLLVVLLAVVNADIYMHSPRGSNNRNCEVTANRANDNRLFDSQNNGKGGYACPRNFLGSKLFSTTQSTMYYHTGSILRISWTAQHSCGFGNNDCQIVIQYACDDTLKSNARDGTPTTTDAAATTTAPDTDQTNTVYGMHENLANYANCKTRLKNGGLYIADQGIGYNNQGVGQPTATSIFTRQNNDGGRSGNECPEERDYYPYWHPTPWRDIAVFTSQTGNCSYYQAESQNVKEKGDCYDTSGVFLKWNNYKDCVSNNGKWVVTPAFGTAPPVCKDLSSVMSLDNHLGFVSATGQQAYYDWAIPSSVINDQCVLRIRYNVTTSDTPWNTDSTNNGANTLLGTNPYTNQYGFNYPISLRYNTDQGGRTFQDRSYIFRITKRPSTIPDTANIYNIGVMGKRGNIVDTYPAVQYDFVPNNLKVFGSDYVHFQWTGSDYNPNENGNDGNGGPVFNNRAGSDRSNLVQTDRQGLSVPRAVQYNTMFLNTNGQPDLTLINQFALLGQDLSQCRNETQLASDLTVATTYATIRNSETIRQADKNCALLNMAPVYFDAGPVQLRASGTFYYQSTRNNNFSNRSQKGQITVIGGMFSSAKSNIPSIGLMAFVWVALALFVL